jgi:hypothetical protein
MYFDGLCIGIGYVAVISFPLPSEFQTKVPSRMMECGKRERKKSKE